jgi:hypothetical protein
MLISRVAKAFKKHGVPFGVVGGYAVALHGAVRGTVDLDLVLRLRRKDFVAAAEALAGLGLQPKLPVTAGEVFDFREDYIARRNLVAWSFWNPTDPSEMVDVVITHDLDKMDIVTMRLGGEEVPVVSRKDLIAMKKESARPQDLEDIKALEFLDR